MQRLRFQKTQYQRYLENPEIERSLLHQESVTVGLLVPARLVRHSLQSAFLQPRLTARLSMSSEPSD
jgi:hypothetical protein